MIFSIKFDKIYKPEEIKMRIDSDEMICVNCVHRDYGHETFLPVNRPWGICIEACCPCLLEACDCDAGACVLMLAEDGHCRYHEEAFEPCEEFLEMLESRCENDCGYPEQRLAMASLFAGI